MIADYANKVPGNALSQSLPEDQRQSFDKLIDELRTQFPEKK